MTERNFSKYTIEQLRSLLSGIDRGNYPELVKEIEMDLEEKLSNPELVLKSKEDSGFFESHVPSKIVNSIWLKMFGWSFVTTIVIGLPLVLLIAFLLSFFGIDALVIHSIANIIYMFVYFSFSWLCLRKIIGGFNGGYEIVFVRKGN